MAKVIDCQYSNKNGENSNKNGVVLAQAGDNEVVFEVVTSWLFVGRGDDDDDVVQQQMKKLVLLSFLFSINLYHKKLCPSIPLLIRVQREGMSDNFFFLLHKKSIKHKNTISWRQHIIRANSYNKIREDSRMRLVCQDMPVWYTVHENL